MKKGVHIFEPQGRFDIRAKRFGEKDFTDWTKTDNIDMVNSNVITIEKCGWIASVFDRQKNKVIYETGKQNVSKRTGT